MVLSLVNYLLSFFLQIASSSQNIIHFFSVFFVLSLALEPQKSRHKTTKTTISQKASELCSWERYDWWGSSCTLGSSHDLCYLLAKNIKQKQYVIHWNWSFFSKHWCFVLQISASRCPRSWTRACGTHYEMLGKGSYPPEALANFNKAVDKPKNMPQKYRSLVKQCKSIPLRPLFAIQNSSSKAAYLPPSEPSRETEGRFNLWTWNKSEFCHLGGLKWNGLGVSCICLLAFFVWISHPHWVDCDSEKLSFKHCSPRGNISTLMGHMSMLWVESLIWQKTLCFWRFWLKIK